VTTELRYAWDQGSSDQRPGSIKGTVSSIGRRSQQRRIRRAQRLGEVRAFRDRERRCNTSTIQHPPGSVGAARGGAGSAIRARGVRQDRLGDGGKATQTEIGGSIWAQGLLGVSGTSRRAMHHARLQAARGKLAICGPCRRVRASDPRQVRPGAACWRDVVWSPPSGSGRSTAVVRLETTGAHASRVGVFLKTSSTAWEVACVAAPRRSPQAVRKRQLLSSWAELSAFACCWHAPGGGSP